MEKLNVGDSVGMLQKREKDGKKFWKLVEDKINKITITKRYGRRYFTKSKFLPLDADDIDSNTEIMEESIGKNWILTHEIFGLNDKTRTHAERWAEWANENLDKAVSIISQMSGEDNDRYV